MMGVQDFARVVDRGRRRTLGAGLMPRTVIDARLITGFRRRPGSYGCVGRAAAR